jgi:hypothetical protein
METGPVFKMFVLSEHKVRDEVQILGSHKGNIPLSEPFRSTFFTAANFEE